MPMVSAAVAGGLAKAKIGKKIFGFLKQGWGLLKKGAAAVTKNKNLVETALGGVESNIVPSSFGTVVQSPEQQSKSSTALLYGALGLGAYLLLKK